MLGDWLEHEEAEHGACTEQDRAKILTISASSLDRLLRPLCALHPKGLCGTKPGSLLRHQIPIRTEFWDVKGPGFMEADTVAHCGNFLAGDFAWSLCMMDIHTTWTECRAVWNKGSKGVIEQIKSIEAALSFELKGFDCAQRFRVPQPPSRQALHRTSPTPKVHALKALKEERQRPRRAEKTGAISASSLATTDTESRPSSPS